MKSLKPLFFQLAGFTLSAAFHIKHLFIYLIFFKLFFMRHRIFSDKISHCIFIFPLHFKRAQLVFADFNCAGRKFLDIVIRKIE